MKIGENAVGIIFERLIQGLSYSHDIDVLTADYNPSVDLSKVSNIIISKGFNTHPRIKKFFISAFGVDPLDCLWAWKSKKHLKPNKNNEYDIILSFLSFQYYAALIAGNYIAKNNKAKFAVHTLDAIPAPGGWLKMDSYYEGLKKIMARYLKNVDAFFSTNTQMLEYQLKTFTPKVNLITTVIYNPGHGGEKEFPIPETGINNFVYTGGIYGLRKSIYILKAFEKLVDVYPVSKLIFVGTQLSQESLGTLNSTALQKIEFIPLTRNLDPFYNCATALIDIDADTENDVFLSSKITSYLMVNRIIISETGKNSPASQLLKGIDSILICDHDSEQLCEAMKKSIHLKSKISFDDRSTLIKLFQIENIIENMNNSLMQLIVEK